MRLDEVTSQIRSARVESSRSIASAAVSFDVDRASKRNPDALSGPQGGERLACAVHRFFG
ncbi:MAG TPA: hypothetical protein VIS31_10690 [Woeseiaceae bacterium]